MEFILLVAACFGLAFFVSYLGSLRNKKLEAEGQIVQRDYEFHRTEQLFICDIAPEALFDAIKKRDYSNAGATASQSSDPNRIVFRSSHQWNAQLSYRGKRGDKNVFSYSLTNWHTHKGVAWRVDTMNMLLTSVEKVFLSMDQSTLIEKHKMETKTI